MNINRIFDTPAEHGESDEITLSKEYAKENGEKFSTVKAVYGIDVKAMCLCGMPFVCKPEGVVIDAGAIVKWVAYIFDMSVEEVEQLQINDYMKLMNYIIDGMGDKS